MSLERNQFTLPAEDGLPIGVTQWLPEEAWTGIARGMRFPALIVLHGLKGFANWGSFPFICERIAASGWIVLSVDFSRNGVVDFGSEITRIDLAEGNSITRQINEAELLLDALLRGETLGAEYLDRRRLYVFGHSLGGATALPLAARRREVRGVVTWSSVDTLCLWDETAMAQFEHDGRLNVPNARTGQDFYLGSAYLRDALSWGRAGVLAAASALKKPWLIMHGDADPAVPVAAASRLFQAAAPDSAELVVIEGGDHNFGACHPFGGFTPQLEEAARRTVEWLGSQARH